MVHKGPHEDRSTRMFVSGEGEVVLFAVVLGDFGAAVSALHRKLPPSKHAFEDNSPT